MSFTAPGSQGRLEPTPGWKGNPAGQYDPLPGQARPAHERRRGRVARLIAKLRRR